MNEEEKAIEFLKNKTTNYSSSGEELHYYLILYYLIINLQQENKQLKERLERIDNYLDKNYTMENQYWFDHIRDIVEDR